MKSTSVARLMGIFSPVSVGMSTMTPHNACDDDDDDDDDDDYHGDCAAADDSGCWDVQHHSTESLFSDSIRKIPKIII